MRSIPLGLKDEEGDEGDGEEDLGEEDKEEEEIEMMGEDPMDVGDTPPPTQQLIDPYAPSSSGAIGPSMETSSIPR